jgi:DNA-binding XRE family transcriptional regulator
MKDYRPAKKRATVTVGESVRILRELQEMSQNQLAEASGIPQATISAIENDRVRLGVERAVWPRHSGGGRLRNSVVRRLPNGAARSHTRGGRNVLLGVLR